MKSPSLKRICAEALVLTIVCVCAAEVSSPLIGYMRDRSGVLRRVDGVAGAFVVGKEIERDVLSAAWSGSAGFAKTDSELLLLTAAGVQKRQKAPAGPATFGFLPDGGLGWVRFADGACRAFGGDCPAAIERPRMIRGRIAAGVTQMERFGNGWLVARTDDKLYAVRVAAESDDIYELPEPEQ